DWLIPTSGGRPWLHRPPLPHWVILGIASLAGRCDSEWVVRLAPTLAGTVTVLLLAWMAQLWYGRWTGLLSGLILASSFQFTRYAWLAEEDMILCAVVTATLALFVKAESVVRSPWSVGEGAVPVPDHGPRTTDHGLLRGFLGWRSWTLFGFF